MIINLVIVKINLNFFVVRILRIFYDFFISLKNGNAQIKFFLHSPMDEIIVFSILAMYNLIQTNI